MVIASGERVNSAEGGNSEKIIYCSPLELGIRHHVSTEMAIAGLGRFEATNAPDFYSKEPTKHNQLRVIQTGIDQKNYELFEAIVRQLRNQYISHKFYDGLSDQQATMVIFRTLRTITEVHKSLRKETPKEKSRHNTN